MCGQHHLDESAAVSLAPACESSEHAVGCCSGAAGLADWPYLLDTHKQQCSTGTK